MLVGCYNSSWKFKVGPHLYPKLHLKMTNHGGRQTVSDIIKMRTIIKDDNHDIITHILLKLIVERALIRNHDIITLQCEK